MEASKSVTVYWRGK